MHLDPDHRFNASGECLQAYSDLMCYTVSKQDPGFIHQHVVDAYAAQHAGGPTRPITEAFGLIGLYLALEKGYTGREVQKAHVKIAKIHKEWPLLEPPLRHAGLTATDVVREDTDTQKETMIRKWMESVWGIWEDRHPWVSVTTDELLYKKK
jgi:hypothetical protein